VPCTGCQRLGAECASAGKSTGAELLKDCIRLSFVLYHPSWSASTWDACLKQMLDRNMPTCKYLLVEPCDRGYKGYLKKGIRWSEEGSSF
jgi:hypothetical protein